MTSLLEFDFDKFRNDREKWKKKKLKDEKWIKKEAKIFKDIVKQSNKKKHLEKYNNFQKLHRTNKTSLKSIIKRKDDINKIKKAVKRVNNIKTQTYNFVKLYYLYKLNHNEQIPTIDGDFIFLIMKRICKNPTKANEKHIEWTNICKFYNEVYKFIQKDDVVDATGLWTCLNQEKNDMLSNYKNHISEHFDDFITKFLNKICLKNEIKEILENNNDLMTVYLKDIARLKKDLIFWEDKTDDPCYIEIKNHIRKNIFTKFKKGQNILEQVKKKPLQYLNMAVKMSYILEQEKCGYINCFPLNRSFIPGYVFFDTTTIMHVLRNIHADHYKVKGRLKKFADAIWNNYFRLYSKKIKKKLVKKRKNKKKKNKYKNVKPPIYGKKRRMFQNNKYTFDHQIKTDGIGCSIILKETTVKLKELEEKGKSFNSLVKKPVWYKDEKYVDKLTTNERIHLQNKTVIGIDPGKDDLIYCTDGNNTVIKKTIKGQTVMVNKPSVFRYSQNQRRKELKLKKYRNIRDAYKRYSFVDMDTNNMYFCNKKNSYKKSTDSKSIQKIEDKLSSCNSNTCNIIDFWHYLEKKNKVKKHLSNFYENDLFRKLRWYTFINTQRSEINMIKNFKQKMGTPDNSVICIGDWGQRKQMPYKEPTKGKSFRNLFKKYNYMVYLVCEYNTSKMNAFTGEEMEKFRKKTNPKKRVLKAKFRKNPELKSTIKSTICHGLLRSKNVNTNKSQKYMVMNRDFNGSTNIRQKAYNKIHNMDIPVFLQR